MDKTYLEECNKYFAPLDEIIEAVMNDEGICGITNEELIGIIKCNKELMKDVYNELLQ